MSLDNGSDTGTTGVASAATTVDEPERRVLPRVPYAVLADYQQDGGGDGLRAARAVSADTILAELSASGLRGRGGAGFPSGRKWRAVLANTSATLPATVVVNAAEGEPGTCKDRAIIDANPYAVIEGALIAAHVLGAHSVTVAIKATFSDQVARLRAAIGEITAAGWCDGCGIGVVEGPDAYLFGEETAMLEVLDGRPPFPRIAPPYRHGEDELTAAHDVLQMAGSLTEAPPTLVSNVETFANVPNIVARGADWFRSVGTPESPGTIVCTVTGAVARPGVAEVPMGTTMGELIERVGGGVRPGRTVKAVLVGVSGAVLDASHLDVPLTYEAMAAAGSSLGSGGYIVVADDQSAVAVAAGASRFLAVESCGQCTPCKQDGLAISACLDAMCDGTVGRESLDKLRGLLGTVADGARCSLARQHEAVIDSLLTRYADEFLARPGADPIQRELIAEVIEITPAGAFLDRSFERKQPDWSYDQTLSGKTAVELTADHRAG